MRLGLASGSVEETRALGAALAAELTAGHVLVLLGGLGAGKTALCQGVAAGLGVEGRVTSPTFTMVSTHAIRGRDDVATLLHADLYRVGSGAEADDLAIAELVEDAAIAVVEWGDVAPDLLGGSQLVVEISIGEGEDDRLLSISADDAELMGRLERGLEAWRHR